MQNRNLKTLFKACEKIIASLSRDIIEITHLPRFSESQKLRGKVNNMVCEKHCVRTQ